jgi:hypothetical protein
MSIDYRNIIERKISNLFFRKVLTQATMLVSIEG